MTDRFTENARRAVSGAILAAKELGHTYVGSEHLLLGLADCTGSTASKLLLSAGIHGSSVRMQIIGLAGLGSRNYVGGEDMTPKCRKILMKASRLAHESDDGTTGTEHILLAMLTEECVAKRIIEMEGASPDELSCMIDGFCSLHEQDVPEVKEKHDTPVIDAGARDLTAAAAAGEFPPITGRRKEEDRLIRILLRRTKNNPCLIGEAGVGKTAVVESLAGRIASGDVPRELFGKRIMALEMASVVAGTKYRGEFEEKLKSIIAEAKSDPSVILFIDEIHTVVGAGSAEGSVDAANILKPPLARGEIRLIAATTPKEYKRVIEKDAALERRFEKVSVGEPGEDECVRMLLCVKRAYEKHHGLAIGDDAVREAVHVSARYIRGRFLPDKAIDLLDEAAAAKRMSDQARGALCAADIDALAEETTGIPLRTLTRSESDELAALEDRMKAKIVGQDAAVKSLCAAVRRAKTGVCDALRPMCSLILAGSPGTGKTLCCRVLSELVFGGEDRMIRLDMSEFSEPHSVARLIGSPPGYVGFGDGGALTEKIRREPFSLVLFDGIEKAHPDVTALLTQILESGRLTDASGLEVSFRSAFVAVTATQTGEARAGFGSNAVSLPELPGGILALADETVVFSPLSADSLAEIALREATAFASRCGAPRFGISGSYREHISALAHSAGATARSVCAAVRKECGDAAAEALLSGDTAGMDLLWSGNTPVMAHPEKKC